jgi:hypothetical protein
MYEEFKMKNEMDNGIIIEAEKRRRGIESSFINK